MAAEITELKTRTSAFSQKLVQSSTANPWFHNRRKAVQTSEGFGRIFHGTKSQIMAQKVRCIRAIACFEPINSPGLNPGPVFVLTAVAVLTAFSSRPLLQSSVFKDPECSRFEARTFS